MKSDTFEHCKFKALREVDITGCEVTPSWFEALTACQSLKCLWVGEEFRHHSGVHALMRTLPRVRTEVRGADVGLYGSSEASSSLSLYHQKTTVYTLKELF